MDERGSPRLGCCLPDHVWICLVKIGHALYVAHWTLEGARLNKAAYPCLLFIALHAIAGCIEPLSWNDGIGLDIFLLLCFFSRSFCVFPKCPRRHTVREESILSVPHHFRPSSVCTQHCYLICLSFSPQKESKKIKSKSKTVQAKVESCDRKVPSYIKPCCPIVLLFF